MLRTKTFRHVIYQTETVGGTQSLLFIWKTKVFIKKYLLNSNFVYFLDNIF